MSNTDLSLKLAASLMWAAFLYRLTRFRSEIRQVCPVMVKMNIVHFRLICFRVRWLCYLEEPL
ncbi:hypothetical protein C1E47_10680 [Vibrio cholerae]|nr:hypothetical protein [Vibrio cholerae]EGR0159541.1 hypothetical protein [Vibrio cholerae]EGR0520265.1 hypothetical protein [Vibrio cholerae]EGR0595612.1 hypothetical protein [Vibrio cholerae]EGR1046734.1 hypothetical protein [Vibrio cholerae]